MPARQELSLGWGLGQVLCAGTGLRAVQRCGKAVCVGRGRCEEAVVLELPPHPCLILILVLVHVAV